MQVVLHKDTWDTWNMPFKYNTHCEKIFLSLYMYFTVLIKLYFFVCPRANEYGGKHTEIFMAGSPQILAGAK